MEVAVIRLIVLMWCLVTLAIGLPFLIWLTHDLIRYFRTGVSHSPFTPITPPKPPRYDLY